MKIREERIQGEEPGFWHILHPEAFANPEELLRRPLAGFRTSGIKWESRTYQRRGPWMNFTVLNLRSKSRKKIESEVKQS